MTESVPVFETKSEFAYRAVRERILDGRLPAGAVIQQRDLAITLGISTTPLREAMRRLSTEGLVDLGAHRDARVAALDPREARELLELRLALEPLAASLAAHRRTASELGTLRAAVAALRPLPAAPGLADFLAHRAFHAAIHRAAGNALLATTLGGLWDKADRYRRLAPGDSSPGDRAHAEHLLILDHIAAGDAGAAEQVVRRHVLASRGAGAAGEYVHPTG